jgi:MYXO-CTERM domain-containing protein
MRTLRTLALTALALCAPLAYASTAHAGVEACGNIHVEANATCEVRTGIACEGSCEPLNLKAQCAANLYPQCSGQCSGQLEAECQGTCEGSCVGECEAEPGTFDCQGSCFADCDAQARASCSDNECLASAQATCEGECQVSCDATPAMATCEVECQGVCEGSCTGQANLDCQIECQRPLYVDCEATLTGGCRAECQTEDGALFCDGQYVDHGGNLAECVSSLRALFGIEVTGYAEGSCSGNMCSGEAGFACTCTADPDHRGRNVALLTFGALFVFGVARRRLR